MAASVAPGDRVLLLEPDTGFAYLAHVDGKGARKQRGLGVFDPDRLVGVAYGTVLPVGAKSVAVLRPTPADLAATVARKAQIITPKDASRIVHELGLARGSRVFECGIGSAAATVLLASAVGPEGRVVAQELRAEFADWAMDNLRRAGLDGRVTVALGDLTAGLAEGVAAAGPFDAALLDLPEPGAALRHLVPALAPGATVAAYTPQVSQMEDAVRALRGAGFVQVRALELVERAWEVKERGSRPSFDGLGHTGFLSFGRWLGRPHAAAGPATPRGVPGLP